MPSFDEELGTFLLRTRHFPIENSALSDRLPEYIQSSKKESFLTNLSSINNYFITFVFKVLLNMKSNIFICILFIFLTHAFMSCGGNENIPSQPEKKQYEDIHAIVEPSASFAADDGSIALNGSSASNVARLLSHTGHNIIKRMGEMQITDAEYKEIKDFTDELVSNNTSNTEIYQTIFRWITTHIHYQSGYVDNNPYPVFKTHQAICQGYANLLNVMLHTQNIPAINANGMLIPVGGHAWNYVYLDDWYVSDPTNNGHYRMSELDTYTHLVPMMLDVDLFEDDQFVYNFYEERLNIRQVKNSGKQLIVPFGINGFRISAFNPSEPLPEVVDEIYMGQNIESLGENFLGLSIHAPNVKHAFVDSANPTLKSYGQVVYRDSQPYYIPAAATIIQFLPIHTFGKNFLKDHAHVETIVIQSGTHSLEAYAFENCPHLQKAYIPEETVVEANAFYGVHPQFKILRGIVKN